MVKTLNWLNMENRRTLHLVNFAMKLINRQDIYTRLKRKLVPRSDIHIINMRNIHKLTMPHHKTAMFKRSIVYNIINIYNLYN